MQRRQRGRGWSWLGIVSVVLMACVLVWGWRAGPGAEGAAACGADVTRGEEPQATDGDGEGVREGSEGALDRGGACQQDALGRAEGGWSETRRESGSLEQVATRLLRSYRDTGSCVLARSGFVDLTGSVWSCVVQGDGWTDVCIVCTTEEADVCELRVLRLEADEMAELLTQGP